MCVLPACVYLYSCGPGACRDQKPRIGSPRTELQTVQSHCGVLGIKARSSARATSTLMTEPSLQPLNLKKIIFIVLLQVYVYVHECHMCAGTDPLELELQAAASYHVGTGYRRRASVRTRALNHWRPPLSFYRR